MHKKKNNCILETSFYLNLMVIIHTKSRTEIHNIKKEGTEEKKIIEYY